LAPGEAAPAGTAVTEIPFAHHLAALGAGDDSKVGVPIFSRRGFPHTAMVVRADAGIDSPSALAGKKVGIADLAGSEALWTRGALAHEFGVDTSSVQWFGEHQGASPEWGGGNLVSRDSSVGEQLLAGQLDAAVLGADPSLAAVAGDSSIRRLFGDARGEARRYHDKTGFFPVLSVVVVSRDVVRRFPWVVLNLYSAFLDSKLQAISDSAALLAPYLDAGVINAATGRALGGDIYTYGVSQQKDLLEAAAGYASEQGLSSSPLGLEEIFYPPTLEL
jgi:4,5-dihydroxyphthalate decarboxylase